MVNKITVCNSRVIKKEQLNCLIKITEIKKPSWKKKLWYTTLTILKILLMIIQILSQSFTPRQQEKFWTWIIEKVIFRAEIERTDFERIRHEAQQRYILNRQQGNKRKRIF